MRTSEFKKIIQNAGFEYKERFYKLVEIVSDKLILATVSLDEEGTFKILVSKELSKQMISDIMEYAYTPLNERSDKTYNIEFTEQEINGLVDALNTSNVQVIFEDSHYEAKFKFHDLNGFNAFIDRIVSLYNVIKRYEK